MLVGLVKKNGIMMIDFAIARQLEGRTPPEAVHEACMERFRPIIMTTLAAFFGALPLVLGFWGGRGVAFPAGFDDLRGADGFAVGDAVCDAGDLFGV